MNDQLSIFPVNETLLPQLRVAGVINRHLFNINLKKITMETNEIIEKTIARLNKKLEKEHLKPEKRKSYQRIDDLKESISALESLTGGIIILNKAETRSNHNRVEWAEGLISQLPVEHDGRNSWLLNYGTKDESVKLRQNKKLNFDETTKSCELAG